MKMSAKKTMTPEIYENKRNQLIVLIENILKTATSLPEKSRNELEDTISKLKRNSFEIVVVGEFQGGKSTLFDTICDGRDLSPRGSGIKTSACKISAQSVPAEEKERVVLRWKNDEELMLTMLDLVKDNLMDDPNAYALFTKKNSTGDLILPSLSDNSIRDLATKALTKEWETYCKRPAAYDPEQTGRLDLLQISWIILNFYNNPELKQLRTKTQISPDELKSLVVFPIDWTIRWAKDKKETKWRFEEVPFVFLGEAEAYIHSRNLERLGCVITDCPGLFAGPWDTMIAHNAMINADAILYLIGGEKQVTDSDLRALAHIRNTDQGHKVFFAINARKGHDDIVKMLRPVDFAMIQQRGFAIDKDEDIDVFNALLAFNSRHTPEDRKAWQKETGKAIQTYLQLDMFDDTDKETIASLLENVDELYKNSGAPELLSKIETCVVLKKFESILVKGGTNKAGASLDVIDGDLKVKESIATKDLEKAQKDVADARAQLNDFQHFAQKKVDDTLDDPVSADLLAQDFWQNVYINQASIMADSIATKIHDRFTSSTELLKIVWDLMTAKVKAKIGKAKNAEEDAQRRAANVLHEPVIEAVEQTATPAANGWLANIRDGGNRMFSTAYGRALTMVGNEVRRKWDSMFGADTQLLEGLALDFDVTPSPVTSSIGKQDSHGGVAVQKQAMSVLLKKLATMIGAIAVGVVSTILIAYIVISIGLGGIPAILVVLAGVFCGAAFWEYVNEKILDGMVAKMRPEISEKLNTLFSQKQEEIKEAAKKELVTKIVEELKSQFRDSLKKQKDAFESRVKEMMDLKQKSQAEQERVAKEAKDVREQQIAPARKQIAEFFKALVPYFE